MTMSIGRRVIDLARARGVAGFSLTIAMSGALVVMAVLDRTLPGRRLVDACCVVRASEPMHVELARLIGSILASAPHLPLWGAVIQVVVVVGIAELLLGWRWVLAIGLATATLLSATSLARVEHLVAAGVGMFLGLAGRAWYGVVSGRAAIPDRGSDVQAVWRSQTFAEASKGDRSR